MNAASTPDKRTWVPAFLANAVIWGASFIFIKIAVGTLHPTWVAAGRTLAGAATLLIILAVLKEKLPRERWLWGHMLVPGVVGVAIPFTLFAYGEESISSLLAGIWNATTGLWVLPFAVLVFGTERFTARSVIGLVLGFAGVLVVLGFWHAEGGNLTGQLMCAVAALCYGFYVPYTKKFITGRAKVSGVALATMQITIGAVVTTIAAFVLSGPPPAPTTWGWDVLGSILALGVFGSGIALALNMRVIQLVGASTAAFVTYLIPLVAVALGILVLNETLAWNQPVGALIVLIGVAVSQGVFARRAVSAPLPSAEAAQPARR